MQSLKKSVLGLLVAGSLTACSPNPVSNVNIVPSATPSPSVNVTGGFGSSTGNQTTVNNGTWSSGTTPNNNYPTVTTTPSGSSFLAGGTIGDTENTDFLSHTDSQTSIFISGSGKKYYGSIYGTNTDMWSCSGAINEKPNGTRHYTLRKYPLGIANKDISSYYVDISIKIVNKSFHLEVTTNLSDKEYTLAYLKEGESSIVRDKKSSPNFIESNLTSGKYKLWLEIGSNVIDLEPVIIE